MLLHSAAAAMLTALAVQPSPASAQTLPAAPAKPAPVETAASAANTEAAPANSLPAVAVSGFRAEQVAGPKALRSLQDTPRIITVLPQALLEEQGVSSLKDALRNLPGISLQAGEGNPPGGDQLKIRGFNARDDINVNGARDLGNYFRDPFYVDQLEVVKGPNSTFSGRGSAGGTINFVSKMPLLQDFGQVELSLGTAEQRRATLDVNRRLGDDLAVRVNLMAHEADIPGRDIAEEQRYGLYAAATWGFKGDTRVTADLLHMRQDDLPDAGLPFDRDAPGSSSRGTGALPPGLRSANFYGHADDHKKVDVNLVGLTVEHHFGSGTLLRNQLRLSRVGNDSITSSPRIRNIPAASSGFEGAQVRGDTKPRDQTDEGVSNQTSLQFSLGTGAIRHDIVTGIEIGRYSYDNKRRPDAAGPMTDLYSPQPRLHPATPYDGTVYSFNTEELAVYALDVVSLTPQWDLNLGLRWDRVTARASEAGRENLATPGSNLNLQRTDHVASGSIGLVFKPDPKLSLYAALGNAFEVSGNFDRNQVQLAGGGSARVADPATFNIAPEQTQAFELGAKWMAAADLTVNAAVFETRKNKARFPGQAGGDNSVLDARLRIRGFELLTAGSVTREWRLYSGYTWLDSRVLAAPSQPFAVGQELGGTPRHSFNLFTTYDIAPWLSLGGGLQHVTRQFSSVQASATGTRKVMIPGYTVADLYATLRLSKQTSLRINAFNVDDRAYISQVAEGGAQGIPGRARQVVATLRHEF